MLSFLPSPLTICIIPVPLRYQPISGQYLHYAWCQEHMNICNQIRDNLYSVEFTQPLGQNIALQTEVVGKLSGKSN